MPNMLFNRMLSLHQVMGDLGLMLKLLLHFQGVIRVPFIWNDPHAPANSAVNDDLASSIDISATIL
ncbi:MAG: hypothetical protein ACR2O8_05300, partial [Rhizobiaceae bacterium]